MCFYFYILASTRLGLYKRSYCKLIQQIEQINIVVIMSFRKSNRSKLEASFVNLASYGDLVRVVPMDTRPPLSKSIFHPAIDASQSSNSFESLQLDPKEIVNSDSNNLNVSSRFNASGIY
jgi:hypothetical protein